MNQTEIAQEVFSSIENLLNQSVTEINGVLLYPSLVDKPCKFTVFFASEVGTEYTYEWKSMIDSKFTNQSSNVEGVSWGKTIIGVPDGFKVSEELEIVTANPDLQEIESQIAMACEIVEEPVEE